ncbi:hypothetical protein M427DRAFT_37559 [Gonapodya prolifera JEL478]|uniref:Uncharacterized protein n=1 Tax=Gonapodya prolifera (strain JEL478) TaxID=1344416 RepID=A0A139A0K6_GONPJ|nr:hypothetical protein M427DRAFT_37559 [Gonapodya prolifera JEL478]|eukprot:KXS10291.1 hypothetical protein M427DRAFT_37559 [Gonapodya prolifera JEL478]
MIRDEESKTLAAVAAQLKREGHLSSTLADFGTWFRRAVDSDNRATSALIDKFLGMEELVQVMETLHYDSTLGEVIWCMKLTDTEKLQIVQCLEDSDDSWYISKQFLWAGGVHAVEIYYKAHQDPTLVITRIYAAAESRTSASTGDQQALWVMLAVPLCLNVPYTGRVSTPKRPTFTDPTVNAIKQILAAMLSKQGSNSNKRFHDHNLSSRQHFCARSILQFVRASLVSITSLGTGLLYFLISLLTEPFGRSGGRVTTDQLKAAEKNVSAVLKMMRSGVTQDRSGSVKLAMADDEMNKMLLSIGKQRGLSRYWAASSRDCRLPNESRVTCPRERHLLSQDVGPHWAPYRMQCNLDVGHAAHGIKAAHGRPISREPSRKPTVGRSRPRRRGRQALDLFLFLAPGPTVGLRSESWGRMAKGPARTPSAMPCVPNNGPRTSQPVRAGVVRRWERDGDVEGRGLRGVG